MTNARLTACLLTFNHAHVLPEVIESILGQTFSDFELLISDDCSTDDSWSVIQQYVARDSRVRAYQTCQNVGMARNANSVIQRAGGDFIALLHHDDVLEPTLFESWIRVAQKDSEISFVFNNYLVENKQLAHYAEPIALSECMDGDAFLRDRLLLRFDSPVRGTALIRASALRRVGPLDERFRLLADVDLWMRLSKASKVGYVQKPLIRVYRRHRSGYPADYVSFTWERFRIVFEIHAVNINRAYETSGLSYMLAVARFRYRVSLEVFKWTIYAILKKRIDILTEVKEGISIHEAPILNRAAKWLAQAALVILRLDRT